MTVDFAQAEKQQWLSNATECINMRMYDPAEDAEETSFCPDFTYPFFGEDELIYGFKGLQIFFSAASLVPYISAKFESKRRDADVNTSIIEPLLRKMYPHVQSPLSKDSELWFSDMEAFKKHCKKDAKWEPLGQKVHSYTHDQNPFEVYQVQMDTPGFVDFHRRMQVFLLFFIEGASYIEEDDSKWQVFHVLKKSTVDRKPSYVTVGYATCYPFFHYPDKLRVRISQYLILPVFQKQGHGSALYRFLYSLYSQRPDVIEVCLEDPSDGFTQMRLQNDLRLLLQDKQMINIYDASKEIPSRDTMEKVRVQYKFSRLYFSQLAELYVLKRLQQMQIADNSPLFDNYRICVKKRIYRKNEEALSALEGADEVKEKIAEVFELLQEDYLKILDRVV